jgi:hypothetical protein
MAQGIRCVQTTTSSSPAAATPDHPEGHSADSPTSARTATLCSTNAAPCQDAWQLQSLRFCPSPGCLVLPLTGVFLQQLPAATLTELVCKLDFKQPENLLAVCRSTALRSLCVLPALLDAGGEMRSNADYASMELVRLRGGSTCLSPMSALQQLTELKLPYVTHQQLVHL